MEKYDFRCVDCDRLLGKVSGDAEIKCPRCGTVNVYHADTGTIESIPKNNSKRNSHNG